MVRLKDIAEKAGVSVMTVSKALRGENDIAVATRERVQRIAASLGYVPNPMARALRGRRTRLLGLVIPATTDPVYSRVMMAIEQGAHEVGCDLILGQSLGQVEREEAVIRKMLARRVEGLLISPVPRMETKSAAYEQLRESETPVVVLGQRGAFVRALRMWSRTMRWRARR